MADSNRNKYRDEMDAKRILQIREIARDLPQACGDFLRAIALTTSSLTRLAYAIDLNTFFQFLHQERLFFAQKPIPLLDDSDLEKLTQSDLTAYTEYLTYYLKSDESHSEDRVLVNHDLAIKRKLCSIRSFYDYLFKNQRIGSNITELVPLPKIHEKPILRLSKAEMMKLLSTAQDGADMSKGQQRFQRITARRDYAILCLFLGTGMRVSECVGINLRDLDMENNAVLVTRKGGNQVVLYFPPETADALGEYLEERKEIETLPGHEDALFLSLQKKRISQRAVQNLVNQLKEKKAEFAVNSGDLVKDYEDTLKRLLKEDGQSVKALALDDSYQFHQRLFEGWQQWGAQTAALYDERLHELHGLDFADLLVQVDELFRQDSVASKWARRFVYINIDEVQDTSLLEYRIISQIFGASHLLL